MRVLRTTAIMRQALKQKAHQASLNHDPIVMSLGDILALVLDDLEDVIEEMGKLEKNEPPQAA